MGVEQMNIDEMMIDKPLILSMTLPIAEFYL